LIYHPTATAAKEFPEVARPMAEAKETAKRNQGKRTDLTSSSHDDEVTSREAGERGKEGGRRNKKTLTATYGKANGRHERENFSPSRRRFWHGSQPISPKSESLSLK
jgi:ABC-type branched-subunit amino acid transport system substrate-binding protein